jgi:hypothetical protein
MEDIEKTSIFGTTVHAVLRSPATTVDAVAERLRAAAIPVTATHIVEPSLEDVFLDVAERSVA